MHHHCRISSNEHLPYPICGRRRLLHLLVGAVPPVASIALFSLLRAPVRATTHRLSVLYREGIATLSTTIFLSSSVSSVALTAGPCYYHQCRPCCCRPLLLSHRRKAAPPLLPAAAEHRAMSLLPSHLPYGPCKLLPLLMLPHLSSLPSFSSIAASAIAPPFLFNVRH
ncbi:hypothetical protein B296_00031281 [Ensete ventricosum]|uniref:Uncharacterized protein n=1 Tax=Ensete ventricosum TaxID=4639 RepID=A0A426XHN0_ENSVE|nr:hypothetical protein B296_00031281 [Ensete ventricosum]